MNTRDTNDLRGLAEWIDYCEESGKSLAFVHWAIGQRLAGVPSSLDRFLNDSKPDGGEQASPRERQARSREMPRSEGVAVGGDPAPAAGEEVDVERLLPHLVGYVAFRVFGTSGTCTNSQNSVRCEAPGIVAVAFVDRAGCPQLVTCCEDHRDKLLYVLREHTNIEEFST